MQEEQTTNSGAAQKRRELWNLRPKWLIPIAVILSGFLIFFIAQFAGIYALSFYALIQGWSTAQANAWINNSITAQFVYVLTAEAVMVGLIYAILKFYNQSLASIGFGPKFKLRYIAYALMAYPVYLVVFLIASKFATSLFPYLNVNQAQQIGFNSVHGGYQLALTFISLVILPPIAEEILFRGFIFEGLKKAMPVVLAGVLVSVIFAVAHLPEGGSSGPLWIGAIDTFILSLVLVFLKQKTKSLWPGILLHALKNLIAFMVLFVVGGR